MAVQGGAGDKTGGCGGFVVLRMGVVLGGAGEEGSLRPSWSLRSLFFSFSLSW